MERRVLRGERPSSYTTLSVLSGVGGLVDREAGLCMNCDGVLRDGCLTNHRMNALRVLASLEVQDVGVRVSDIADPHI